MRQLVGGLQGDTTANTSLAEAQNLAYEAFEEPDPARQVELARAALWSESLSPVVAGEKPPGRKNL